MRFPRWRPEPEWAGQTAAVLGAGPSLVVRDVDAVHEAGWRAIAVNNAFHLAPWADILYFGDARWWRWHHDTPEYRAFAGRRVTLENDHVNDVRLARLSNHAREGMCFEPGRICNGASSGYQAINLAAQLGAARIVLLGFDQRTVDGATHFHAPHPTPTPEAVYANLMLRYFETAAPALRARGIVVVNATPGSAITCWPIVPLAHLIARDACATRS